MLLQIIRHTPPWVGVLLLVLFAAGAVQLRSRRVPAWQPLLLPLLLLGLGASMLLPLAAAQRWAPAVWLLALAAAGAAGWRVGAPAGSRWDAAAQRLLLPGSALRW